MSYKVILNTIDDPEERKVAAAQLAKYTRRPPEAFLELFEEAPTEFASGLAEGQARLLYRKFRKIVKVVREDLDWQSYNSDNFYDRLGLDSWPWIPKTGWLTSPRWT